MNKIKKLLLFLLVCAFIIPVSGCGTSNVDGELTDIMDKVYADVPDDQKPMMLEKIEVSKELENMESFIGTSDINYEEILASESGVGSIAHSVVLVRMKDVADVEEAKVKIKENVDPRKWICVGVEDEDVIVKSRGNLIILIMVQEESTRNILENGFDNL